MNRRLLIILAIAILSLCGCSTHPDRIVDLGLVELAPTTPKEFSCGPGLTCTITPGRTVADEIKVALVLTNEHPRGVMEISRSVHSGEFAGLSLQDIDVELVPKLNADASQLSARSSDDSSDRFMTTFETFSPARSPWTIRVSDSDRKLQISRRTAFGSTGVSPSEWRAKPGWFAFVENDQRAWAYDGNKDLFLLEVRSDKSTVSYGPYRFPCPVPDEVFTKLSSASQKVIKEHQK